MTATPARTRQKLRPGAVLRCRTRRYLVEDGRPPSEPGADTVVSISHSSSPPTSTPCAGTASLPPTQSCSRLPTGPASM